jgi:hypothetical protein
MKNIYFFSLPLSFWGLPDGSRERENGEELISGIHAQQAGYDARIRASCSNELGLLHARHVFITKKLISHVVITLKLHFRTSQFDSYP